MEKLYNLSQKKNIRKILRKQPITCERILWGRLRDRQLGDFKFKRQYSIGKYVVDFFCSEIGLVVEIDGATHSTDEEIKYDEIRQKFLESEGIVVKRYNNSDIKDNLLEVLNDILIECKKRRRV